MRWINPFRTFLLEARAANNREYQQRNLWNSGLASVTWRFQNPQFLCDFWRLERCFETWYRGAWFPVRGDIWGPSKFGTSSRRWCLRETPPARWKAALIRGCPLVYWIAYRKRIREPSSRFAPESRRPLGVGRCLGGPAWRGSRPLSWWPLPSRQVDSSASPWSMTGVPIWRHRGRQQSPIRGRPGTSTLRQLVGFCRKPTDRSSLTLNLEAAF